MASLERIRSADGDRRRQQLRENISILSAKHPSPVVPVLLGGNEAALAASARLESRGFLVPAIRYPTVPRGTARLRISVSAAHPPETVAALASEICGI
jgi:7-keto-8-aminopelargonate synthetase-like enzyme